MLSTLPTLNDLTLELFQAPLFACTPAQALAAAMALCRRCMAGLPRPAGSRRLYYLSAEFLLGKLLSCNLLNLGLYDTVAEELAGAGMSLAQLEDAEPEPSLGNGGLGRLAACFLDSIATLGLPGDGVGLCYHQGLFRQFFAQNKQQEAPDPWLDTSAGRGWLEDMHLTFPVQLGGGAVTGRLYGLDVPGYGGKAKNKLYLFDLDGVDEGLIHDGITFDKTAVDRNLTLFLYPDDSDHAGRMLRIYQQYFLVSCAAQLILHQMDAAGQDVRTLPEHVVIQINDTHPSMVIPELVRLLCARGVKFEQAAALVARTCAYTNHTILAEALEKWPLANLETAAPALGPVVRRLDALAKARHPGQALAIIDGQGLVHMARMDMHYGFSVNGVASLHTEILKTSELAPFYEIYPQKFTNKTNGITFRRWLTACNRPLADWLTARIGPGWQQDADKLEALLGFRKDAAALKQLLAVKQGAKQALAARLAAHQGVTVSADSVFDVQIKRLHEYKRQQMNLLYIIWKYREIQAGRLPARPVTFLFGAKAAPAYTIAKDIIHALLCMAQVIGRDETARRWPQLVFVDTYNVTWAEALVPAADISEQISLASKEASGTGNMKLMLNGAVTLGTLDGANVEIAQLVGAENIYLFGRSSSEVMALYENHSYSACTHYKTPFAEPLVDFLLSKPMLEAGDAESLGRLYQDITHKDWFMALLDLEDYVQVKERMLADYEDRNAWAEKMLVNIAKAGFFSSDRTIRQYNQNIWKL